MFKTRLLRPLTMLLFFVCCMLAGNGQYLTSTRSFGTTPLNIQGFTIYLFVKDINDPTLTQALFLLSQKLEKLSALIKPEQLSLLQNVPICVEYKLKPQGAMWYHKSKEWLIENGYPAEMAKCVEICNIKNFIAWQKQNQPYMVLHELAHAYHDQVLGSENRDVLDAYNSAMKTRKYESVAYNLGGRQRAYAVNNADEYFAEITEAYLGVNDYYPFNRTQLKSFDPKGYALMQRVWGD